MRAEETRPRFPPAGSPEQKKERDTEWFDSSVKIVDQARCLSEQCEVDIHDCSFCETNR